MKTMPQLFTIRRRGRRHLELTLLRASMVVSWIVLGAWPQLAFAAETEDAPATLKDIAADYGMEIVDRSAEFPVRTAYGMIDGKPASGPALESYGQLFAEEFSLYPSRLVQRALLKRIVLCEELSYAGQRRNAIPDFEHNTLYLDVRRGAYNPAYMRKVIHHEFFHIVDYRDDGQLFDDKQWSQLNGTGFSYGTGGRNAQNVPTTSVLTDKYPGFLNHYCTTAVEEDKAEVFANLVFDPDYMQQRAAKDAVIEAKVQRMRELLLRFCPDMTPAYWKNIAERRRSDKGKTQ